MKKQTFKIYLLLPIIIGSFLLGSLFSTETLFSKDIKFLGKIIKTNKVKVCNNTDRTITSFFINDTINYGAIYAKQCSDYLKINQLFDLVPFYFTVAENYQTSIYKNTGYIDTVGMEKHMGGNFILNIDSFSKESKIIQKAYINSIEYSLKNVNP